MLVSIGTYELCDGTLEGGVSIGQARFSVERQIEVVVPIGELNPVLFDRVNRRFTLEFSVWRTFEDSISAEAFILGLDAEIPSTGTITLWGEPGATFFLVPNGLLLNHHSTQMGSSVSTTYTLTGGQPVV